MSRTSHNQQRRQLTKPSLFFALSVMFGLLGQGIFAPSAFANDPPEQPAPPSPSAAASGSHAAPASSDGASPQGAKTSAAVKVHDHTVITLKASLGGRSPAERAKQASKELESVFEEPNPGDIKTVAEADRVVVYVGTRPILELGPEDAESAGAASVQVLAASAASHIDENLKEQQNRRNISTRVASFSLAVLFALLGVLVIRKLSELIAKARSWVEDEERTLPALQLRGIEVVSPAALRSASVVGLSVAKLSAQLGVGYAWLLYVLSLFDTTRALSKRLTGTLFSPISDLVARAAGTAPLLVLLTLGALLVALAVRFVGLFFDGVSRGETRLEWLSPDLARPTSIIIRSAIVLLSVVIGLPFTTGSSDDAIARAGTIVVAAIGVAMTPLLAASVIGSLIVFGRRLRVGDIVELAGNVGRIRELTLTETRLEDEQGAEIRVPHLLTMVRVSKILGRTTPAVVEITVRTTQRPPVIKELLADTARTIGNAANVELLALEANAQTYRVSIQTDLPAARSDLLLGLAEALTMAGAELAEAKIVGSAIIPMATPMPATVARRSVVSMVPPVSQRPSMTPPMPPSSVQGVPPVVEPRS